MTTASRTCFKAALALGSALLGLAPSAHAQDQQKPNILFIMGDDIGWMQPSIYHRGLMVGETPNIDRIGQEGREFTRLLRRAELHRRAQRLLHRHASAAHRHDPAAAPGQPVLSAARHAGDRQVPARPRLNTGEFGKNHLGDHTEALPTAHGFQEFWGYLYHLDAMQGVSFPDINRTPDRADASRHPARTRRFPACLRMPGAVDPKTTLCLTPPRPVLWCKSSDGTAAEPDVQGRGSADAGTVEDGGRGNLGQGHRLPRSQRSEEDRQAVLRLVQPRAHAHHDRAVRQVHGDGRRARRQGLGRQRSRHEADGRQHRPRAQEARGDGSARQHHRRLHDRQRRRDDHLPGWRHDAFQGRQAHAPGKAACARRWSCAGPATSSPER